MHIPLLVVSSCQMSFAQACCTCTNWNWLKTSGVTGNNSSRCPVHHYWDPALHGQPEPAKSCCMAHNNYSSHDAQEETPPVACLSWSAAKEPAQPLPSVHHHAGAQSGQQLDAAEFEVMLPALLHLADAGLPAEACCKCRDNQAAACTKQSAVSDWAYSKSWSYSIALCHD